MKYEKQAIQDMLSEGLEREDGPISTVRPRLGYLIKMRFSKSKEQTSESKSKRRKRTTAIVDTQDVTGLISFACLMILLWIKPEIRMTLLLSTSATSLEIQKYLFPFDERT
jgi:hypothetical protein